MEYFIFQSDGGKFTYLYVYNICKKKQGDATVYLSQRLICERFAKLKFARTR